MFPKSEKAQQATWWVGGRGCEVQPQTDSWRQEVKTRSDNQIIILAETQLRDSSADPRSPILDPQSKILSRRQLGVRKGCKKRRSSTQTGGDERRKLDLIIGPRHNLEIVNDPQSTILSRRQLGV